MARHLPEDRFAIIARGGGNLDDRPRLHAMLLSYFDDSSDSSHKEYFAVGGLIGGEKQWSDFYVPWAVATIELKEPFRSTECECQQGQFATWPKPQCDALMRKLVSIVLNQDLHGYASVVPVGDYRAVFPDAKEYDPYYLAVRHTIINMAELGYKEQQRYGSGGVSCSFEDSEATGDTVSEIYRQLRRVESWAAARSLAPSAILEGKETRPLQAADLIAREAFKHFHNLGRRGTRIPVSRLRKVLNFSLWDGRTLAYLRDNGGPDNLELLTSWGSPKRPKPPRFSTLRQEDFC